jgi:hypothetical protein
MLYKYNKLTTDYLLYCSAFALAMKIIRTPFYRIILLIVVGIFQHTSVVQAQDTLASKYAPKVTRFLELGVSANAYRGDLSASYQKWNPAFQAGLKLNFKKRVNSHINLGIGSVSGENLRYAVTAENGSILTPNTFFKTNFITVNYDLQVHLLKYKGLMVYVSQGLGIIRYEPKDAQNNKLLADFSSRANNELYSNVSVVLPTQAGVTYILPNGYGIGFQAGWLNLQNDYIDNISQWGTRQKKDNVLLYRFAFMVPLTYASN